MVRDVYDRREGRLVTITMRRDVFQALGLGEGQRITLHWDVPSTAFFAGTIHRISDAPEVGQVTIEALDYLGDLQQAHALQPDGIHAFDLSRDVADLPQLPENVFDALLVDAKPITINGAWR